MVGLYPPERGLSCFTSVTRVGSTVSLLTFYSFLGRCRMYTCGVGNRRRPGVLRPICIVSVPSLRID